MVATALTTPIGKRTHQVQLMRAVLTSDGQGGKTATYTLRATVWAAEEPLSSRELLSATQLTGELLTAWTMPYRTALDGSLDISISDRILVGTRVLQVTSYSDPTQRRAELRVLCSERLA